MKLDRPTLQAIRHAALSQEYDLKTADRTGHPGTSLEQTRWVALAEAADALDAMLAREDANDLAERHMALQENVDHITRMLLGDRSVLYGSEERPKAPVYYGPCFDCKGPTFQGGIYEFDNVTPLCRACFGKRL